MTLTELAQRLTDGLAGTLPGAAAHARLAPRPRPGWRAGVVPATARLAAGLVLVYGQETDPRLLLTVRAGLLANHGGQVSLPGGAVEDGESVAEAALREANEEVGLDPASVSVLGELSPLFIPVSGFTLHPVVGVCRQTPAFVAASAEVARLLEVPVAHLLDHGRLRMTTRVHDGVEYEVPWFDLGGEQVWGATAMVLAELVEVVGGLQA